MGERKSPFHPADMDTTTKGEIPCGRSHVNHSNKQRLRLFYHQIPVLPLEELPKESNPARALRYSSPQWRIFLCKVDRDSFHYNLSHLVWDERQVLRDPLGTIAGCSGYSSSWDTLNQSWDGWEWWNNTQTPFPFSLPSAPCLRSGTMSVKREAGARFL